MFPALLYHRITDSPARDPYAVSVGAFRKHLEYLKKNGFTSILPGDLDSGIHRKAVMITFDDGHEADYTRAFPLLKEYGFTAVIFVTTGFVGLPGYLDWESVRALLGAGISIQSHSHSHPLLDGVSPRRLRYEMVFSKRMLEKKIGKEVSCLSLPGGRFTPDVLHAADLAGYSCVFTSVPRMNGTEQFETVGRFALTSETGQDMFERIVEGDSRAWARALCRYYAGRMAKRVMGNAYAALWKRLRAKECAQ